MMMTNCEGTRKELGRQKAGGGGVGWGEESEGVGGLKEVTI